MPAHLPEPPINLLTDYFLSIKVQKDLFYILADTVNIFKVQIHLWITKVGYSQKSIVICGYASGNNALFVSRQVLVFQLLHLLKKS